MMAPIRLTRAVKGLAIAFFAVFLIQQTGDRFFGTSFGSLFALTPSDFVLKFRFWQIFTYLFLHADVMHLFLNTLMLVFIGAELEALWGTKRFLRYFSFCAIAAGVLYLGIQLFVYRQTGLHTPMVGASGGIYGLLVAYGILFAERTLLFMMLFPMKAKHFVWVLAGIEFMTTLYSGRGSALSSIAHLGGMGAGFVLLWGKARLMIAMRNKDRWKQLTAGMDQKLKKRSKRGKSSHLKLVVDNDEDDDEGASSGPKVWH